MIGLLVLGGWFIVDMQKAVHRRATALPVKQATYVRSMQRSCPAIAGRLNEYLADGRITAEEDVVVDTIISQQRAVPGQLPLCRYPGHLAMIE